MAWIRLNRLVDAMSRRVQHERPRLMDYDADALREMALRGSPSVIQARNPADPVGPDACGDAPPALASQYRKPRASVFYPVAP